MRKIGSNDQTVKILQPPNLAPPFSLWRHQQFISALVTYKLNVSRPSERFPILHIVFLGGKEARKIEISDPKPLTKRMLHAAAYRALTNGKMFTYLWADKLVP